VNSSCGPAPPCSRGSRSPTSGGERLLTFGAGIHYCVGANLARAEMHEGLDFPAERVTSPALDGEPEFGAPSGINGLEALPLQLELD
jgi:cytochrome P450